MKPLSSKNIYMVFPGRMAVAGEENLYLAQNQKYVCKTNIVEKIIPPGEYFSNIELQKRI